MKKLALQIIKFGIVGVIAFIIDYSILFILTDFFSVYYLLSAAISFTISTIFNYFCSMCWVFEGKKNIKKRNELMIFIFLSVIGLGINQVMMLILVEQIKIFYMISKIIATCVVMIWNFITRKLFLEDHKKRRICTNE